VTTWQELAESAASCTRCDLYKRATATVFGEGKATAAMVLVGEEPGDQEDKQGRPFVGPAGETCLALFAMVIAGPYLSHATMRAIRIREKGDWRQ
jgi:uracil-DNA glycosylase